MHFVSDCLLVVVRDARDRDRGDAAMTAMWSNLNLTVEAFFHQSRENAGEYSFGGIPAKLRLKHLADAGEWHRINWNNLHGNGGALGRALADPRFQFTRLDDCSWFQLHVAHGNSPA